MPSASRLAALPNHAQNYYVIVDLPTVTTSKKVLQSTKHAFNAKAKHGAQGHVIFRHWRCTETAASQWRDGLVNNSRIRERVRQ